MTSTRSCCVNQDFSTKKKPQKILGCTHWWFLSNTRRTSTGKDLIDAPWDPNQHIIKLFANTKKHLTTWEEMKNAIPYLDEDFIDALYLTVKKRSSSQNYVKNRNGNQLPTDTLKHKQEHTSKVYVKSLMLNATHLWNGSDQQCCRARKDG